MNSMVKRPIDPKNPGGAFFKTPRTFPARSGNGKGFPIGKRTKDRAAGNRELNKLPREITHRCELRILGVCIGDRMLQWCHRVKSRFMTTIKDWKVAARGCAACHQYIENLNHKEMAAHVDAAIKRRKKYVGQTTDGD